MKVLFSSLKLLKSDGCFLLKEKGLSGLSSDVVDLGWDG